MLCSCRRADAQRLAADEANQAEVAAAQRDLDDARASALDVLTTWVVAPTSTSAPPGAFRAAVEVAGRETMVLCEQATAVSHTRLGEHVGFLRLEEMQRVDDALRLVFDL